MPNYSFSTLSDYDFECLVRDLLQRDVGVRFEAFARGKDQGIDLRFSQDPANTLVVQCKHFLRSGFSTLKSHIRAEAVKIRALSPARYILATSVPLTPRAKAELVAILGPHCKNPMDIYGADDLNNLLGMYPDIERHHFKLWLASTPVLQAVIHSGIFAESMAQIEIIRNRICRYIKTDAFDRTLDVLTHHGYSIISGLPGIGKTTLARLLLMHHVEQDWEVVYVGDSIAEAWAVLDQSRKQIFYWDDFLGRTGLKDKSLRKNEDERLLAFITQVRRSRTTRFILTTREYILNQAAMVYEGLADPRLDTGKCVVQLVDYPPVAKALILYNHLFFSDLPRSHITAIAEESVYRRIIFHRNFSPRIVEWMTEQIDASILSPAQYVEEFIKNLGTPTRVWSHAFENHLSLAAQDLLLVCASLQVWVILSDLEQAFNAVYNYRAGKYGYSRTSRDFTRALKELDGSFLTTHATDVGIIVGFHNPSIQDFIEQHLGRVPPDAFDLLASAVYPDQVVNVWFAAKSLQSDVRFGLEALHSLRRVYDEPSVHLSKLADGWVGTPYPQRTFCFTAFRIWESSKDSSLSHLLDHFSGWLLDCISMGVEDPSSFTEILSALCHERCPVTANTTALSEKLLDAIVKMVAYRDADVEDFRSIGELLTEYPRIVTDDQAGLIRERFRSLLEWKLEEIDESECPEAVLDELMSPQLLSVVSEDLGTDVEGLILSLEERALQLGYHRWSTPFQSREPAMKASSPDSTTHEELQAIFESLRSP